MLATEEMILLRITHIESEASQMESCTARSGAMQRLRSETYLQLLEDIAIEVPWESLALHGCAQDAQRLLVALELVAGRVEVQQQVAQPRNAVPVRRGAAQQGPLHPVEERHILHDSTRSEWQEAPPCCA